MQRLEAREHPPEAGLERRSPDSGPSPGRAHRAASALRVGEEGIRTHIEADNQPRCVLVCPQQEPVTMSHRKQGFPSSGRTALGRAIPCCGDCPVSRVFSSTWKPHIPATW